jgi:hypothetical protein
MRYEIFIAVWVQIVALSFVISRSLVDGYQRSRGTYFLHLQGSDGISMLLNLYPC